MKPLSAEQMLSFADPDPALLPFAYSRLEKFFPQDWATEWLSYGVKEGFLLCKQVVVEGKPAFVVWAAITPHSSLVVHAIARVSEKPIGYPVALAAAKAYARQMGLKQVAFSSNRAAVIKLAVAAGATIESINLTMDVKKGGKTHG